MTNQTICDPQAEITVEAAIPQPQPTVKLIYRGETFDYTRPKYQIDRTDRSTWEVVQLIYRGHIYDRKLSPSHATYQKPRALNWRWQ